MFKNKKFILILFLFIYFIFFRKSSFGQVLLPQQTMTKAQKAAAAKAEAEAKAKAEAEAKAKAEAEAKAKAEAEAKAKEEAEAKAKQEAEDKAYVEAYIKSYYEYLAKVEAEKQRVYANVEWNSNTNPKFDLNIQKWISSYFWPIEGRIWINRIDENMKLVDWAKVLYENPDFPDANEIAKIVVQNRDSSLTQMQVDAIQFRFNVYQNQPAPPPAPPGPLQVNDNDWNNVDKTIVYYLKNWLKNPAGTIQQTLYRIPYSKYVDWAYALITTRLYPAIAGGPKDWVNEILTNKDGSLNDNQINLLRQAFARYL